MCGNGHNSACSVAHKNIIRNPDRDLFSGNRVCSGKSVKAYTCLVLCKLGALEIRLLSSLFSVSYDCVPVLD